jgi:hypothetical protein
MSNDTVNKLSFEFIPKDLDIIVQALSYSDLDLDQSHDKDRWYLNSILNIEDSKEANDAYVANIKYSADLTNDQLMVLRSLITSVGAYLLYQDYRDAYKSLMDRIMYFGAVNIKGPTRG